MFERRAKQNIPSLYIYMFVQGRRVLGKLNLYITIYEAMHLILPWIYSHFIRFIHIYCECSEEP